MSEPPLTELTYEILISLWAAPRHGYGILRSIQERTQGTIDPAAGTLYTAIRRLCNDGLLRPSGLDQQGRRGRSYSLTPEGRAALVTETERLARRLETARELRVDGASKRVSEA